MESVKTLDQSITPSKSKLSMASLGSNSILLAILAGLFIFASMVSESFLTAGNILNLLRIVSLTGIMAIGVTFVILAGEIDLSVGAILSLSAVIGGQFLDYGIGVVLLVTCGTGLLAGLINGIGVIKGKVPSLIMTLGTMVAFAGLANIISGGKAVYPYKLPSYLWLGKGDILGIPFPIILFAFLIMLSYFILTFTSLGRWIYFSGANRTASRFSGGRTDRIIILTFLVSGLCASLAGPLISGQINRIWPTQGTGYEMAAISIAVLGGNSLTGGNGSVLGTVLAALIFGGLMNLLNLTGVGTYLQDVVKGGLLIMVVGLMYWRQRSKG